MVKGSLSKPLAATTPSGRFALVAIFHDRMWCREAARSVLPRCCRRVYTGIQKMVGASGTRRFPGGHCLVSGGFSWRQRQGAYSGSARHGHEQRGALSHAADGLENRSVGAEDATMQRTVDVSGRGVLGCQQAVSRAWAG